MGLNLGLGCLVPHYPVLAAEDETTAVWLMECGTVRGERTAAGTGILAWYSLQCISVFTFQVRFILAFYRTYTLLQHVSTPYGHPQECSFRTKIVEQPPQFRHVWNAFYFP
jgi:hypothetical protein